MKKELLYAVALFLLISVFVSACTTSYAPTPAAAPEQTEEDEGERDDDGVG